MASNAPEERNTQAERIAEYEKIELDEIISALRKDMETSKDEFDKELGKKDEEIENLKNAVDDGRKEIKTLLGVIDLLKGMAIETTVQKTNKITDRRKANIGSASKKKTIAPKPPSVNVGKLSKKANVNWLRKTSSVRNVRRSWKASDSAEVVSKEATVAPELPSFNVDKLSKNASVNWKRKTITISKPPPTKFGQMVVFQIDAKEAGYEALDITVKDPEHDEIATKVTEIETGVLQVEFNSRLLGRYSVNVEYAGKRVSEGSFECRVYDISKITVDPVVVNEDAKTASFYVTFLGFDEVKCEDFKVTSKDPTFKGYWNSYSSEYNKYLYMFKWDKTKDYEIAVRINNEDVPGSPLHFKATKK